MAFKFVTALAIIFEVLSLHEVLADSVSNVECLYYVRGVNLQERLAVKALEKKPNAAGVMICRKTTDSSVVDASWMVDPSLRGQNPYYTVSDEDGDILRRELNFSVDQDELLPTSGEARLYLCTQRDFCKSGGEIDGAVIILEDAARLNLYLSFLDFFLASSAEKYNPMGIDEASFRKFSHVAGSVEFHGLTSYRDQDGEDVVNYSFEEIGKGMWNVTVEFGAHGLSISRFKLFD